MSKLIIKNGTVVDPLNQIEAEKKDILIEEGNVVEKFSDETNIQEIDAKNKTVIPAALDIHTHIASQQMNWVRLLGRKNKQFTNSWGNLSLSTIAKNYVSNGYTFILEANVFPSLVKQAHLNFKYLPVLDKGISLNVSNLWALESELNKDKYKQAAGFLGDILKKNKSFGLSVANPFEAEDWNLKNLRADIGQGCRLYNFTALDVYTTLIKTNEYLQLPNPIQIHLEGHESPIGKQNLDLILKKINAIDLNSDSSPIMHLVSSSSLNIDGDNSELIKELNTSQKVDIDLGMIGFDAINPLITNDRRLYQKYKAAGNKMLQFGVEMEGDMFTGLRTIQKSSTLFTKIWANALDLALNIEDKWKLQLTFDFPNYSHINNAGRIATWLLSSTARKEFSESLNQEALSETFIGNEEQLTFSEYIIVSRAGPAQSIGLDDIKGNLGVGADGDVNILNVDIGKIDPSSDYHDIQDALNDMEYVVKSGRIIKKKQEFDLNFQGKVFYSEAKVVEANESLLNKKKEFYAKFGSHFYNQYRTDLPENLLRKISN